jgi:hypothetical protein
MRPSRSAGAASWVACMTMPGQHAIMFQWVHSTARHVLLESEYMRWWCVCCRRRLAICTATRSASKKQQKAAASFQCLVRAFTTGCGWIYIGQSDGRPKVAEPRHSGEVTTACKYSFDCSSYRAASRELCGEDCVLVLIRSPWERITP